MKMMKSTILLALIPMVFGCATMRIEATVKRAPTLSLQGVKTVAVEIVKPSGELLYETSQDCVFEKNGGTSKGSLGSIPDERIQEYSDGVKTAVERVISSGGLKIVPREEADVVLGVSPSFTETKAAVLSRCADNPSASTHCLPDPVVKGEKKCGCSEMREGRLDPKDYDWYANVDGSIEMMIGFLLLSKTGEKLGEDSQFLNTAGKLTNSTGGDCQFVSGSPKVVDNCFRAKMNGGRVATAPVWEEGFRAGANYIFKNKDKELSRLFFPYDEQVDYTVFKIDAPAGAETAVTAMKEGSWTEARSAFESMADSVGTGAGLNSEQRARFLYDYGVVLLALGDFDEATKRIEEAKSIAPDPKFEPALEESRRQKADRDKLKGGGAKPVATAEPESQTAADDASDDAASGEGAPDESDQNQEEEGEPGPE